MTSSVNKLLPVKVELLAVKVFMEHLRLSSKDTVIQETQTLTT